MGTRADAQDLEKADGVADTFLVIDDHLRESIGLAQREGWAVLAYLLRMAREQLQEDLKRDVAMTTRQEEAAAADLPAGDSGLVQPMR